MKEKFEREKSDRDYKDGRESRMDRYGSGNDRSSGKRFSRKDFEIEYKDPLAVSRYITDGGKITPARLSKFNLKEQKMVAEAVKRARNIATVPSGTQAYDHFQRAEPISPVPFEI